jgi:hypothetical protein
MGEWKDVPGYEGIYAISKLGVVKSVDRVVTRSNGVKLRTGERILKQSLSSGYPKVSLFINGKGTTFKVHRLIAILFIPNPDNKPFVNHINGIKTDFSISNLEWCTCQENNAHAFKTGLNFSRQTGTTGAKSHHAKAIDQYSLIGDLIKRWDCAMDVENELGFNHTNISKVLTGKRETAYGYKWRYA